ncbi:ATP-binding protein [Streptomyces sp. CNQ085]|nr:ATP-binding protein [Streptomyces sp. CNQ085]
MGDWRLSAEPRSVARARELARRRLTAWGLEDLADTTELLVSELVTNALRHGMGVSPAQPGAGALPARPGVGVPPAAPGVGVPPAAPGGEIRLRLLLDRTLVCEVWDSGLVQPRRRRARDTDEGGRGLQLVDLLSSGWGSRRTPRGKTVWFELALPQEGGPKPSDSVEALLGMF